MQENITVQEAHKKARQLQSLIFLSISKFERDTGYEVNGIYLDHFHNLIGEKYLRNVELDVRLARC